MDILESPGTPQPMGAPLPDPAQAALAPPTEPPVPIDPSNAPPMDPHEEHWLANRDSASEALFAHVGTALLLGGGLSQRSDGLARGGRNLLAEAEHAHATKAARDLLQDPASIEGEHADDIARSHTDEAGLAYLRDNADTLHTQLSTKQAAAAQKLLDSYGKLAQLRPEPGALAANLKGDTLDQSRWVSATKSELGRVMDGAPPELKAAVAKLGKGADPVEWFGQAQTVSDELAKATARARRTDVELADRLDAAKRQVDAGTQSEGLWGPAGAHEGQRASSYGQRVGDHIDAFEEAFTSRVGDAVKADPSKFREFVESDQSGDRAQTLASMLDAAKATADTALRFGKKDEAQAIMGAARTLERSLARSRTVRAAEGGVPRETSSDSSAAALEWLSGGPGQEGQGASRNAVLRAVSAMSAGTDRARRDGVNRLLSPALSGDDDAAPIPHAPGMSLSATNFEAAREHITRMANEPDYFGAVMAASFGNLQQAAPEVYGALAAQTAKTVSYLAAVAPGGTTGGPFSQSIPVGEDELWEFNQRVKGAADPDFIPREMAAGRVSSQAIETHQQLQPAQYQKLRIDTFERLHELAQRGIQVPMQAREQLDTLLNLDGGGEPAMTWQVAERAAAAQHQALQSSGTMGKDSANPERSAMKSGALSTLNNGASAIARSGT